MAYQRNPNDLGAAWEKTSKKGNRFLSIRLDCTHSPETAHALANMLLSGEPVIVLASENANFDPNNDRIPKYSLYMTQQQHDWTIQAFRQAYPVGSAPKYDYRNPVFQQADHGNGANYAAPPTQPPPPPPPAQGYQPPAPVAPPAPAQGQQPPPPPPPSPSPSPQNPFGA